MARVMGSIVKMIVLRQAHTINQRSAKEQRNKADGHALRNRNRGRQSLRGHVTLRETGLVGHYCPVARQVS